MSSFLLFSSRGWSLLLERSRDLERLRDRSRWPVGAAFALKRSARAASRAPKSSWAGAGAGAGAALGARRQWSLCRGQAVRWQAVEQ